MQSLFFFVTCLIITGHCNVIFEGTHHNGMQVSAESDEGAYESSSSNVEAQYSTEAGVGYPDYSFHFRNPDEIEAFLQEEIALAKVHAYLGEDQYSGVNTKAEYNVGSPGGYVDEKQLNSAAGISSDSQVGAETFQADATAQLYAKPSYNTGTEFSADTQIYEGNFGKESQTDDVQGDIIMKENSGAQFGWPTTGLDPIHGNTMYPFGNVSPHLLVHPSGPYTLDSFPAFPDPSTDLAELKKKREFSNLRPLKIPGIRLVPPTPPPFQPLDKPIGAQPQYQPYTSDVFRGYSYNKTQYPIPSSEVLPPGYHYGYNYGYPVGSLPTSYGSVSKPVLPDNYYNKQNVLPHHINHLLTNPPIYDSIHWNPSNKGAGIEIAKTDVAAQANDAAQYEVESQADAVSQTNEGVKVTDNSVHGSGLIYNFDGVSQAEASTSQADATVQNKLVSRFREESQLNGGPETYAPAKSNQFGNNREIDKYKQYLRNPKPLFPLGAYRKNNPGSLEFPLFDPGLLPPNHYLVQNPRLRSG